jgi:hypothetical protein
MAPQLVMISVSSIKRKRREKHNYKENLKLPLAKRYATGSFGGLHA